MLLNIILWAIGLVVLAAILAVAVIIALNTIDFIREWRDN
jgi:hypothetical protein